MKICWSAIIFILVSLVESCTCLECGNTSSTRISSSHNTDGNYIVDIRHHLFDPQVNLVPSQNYTISLHSGNGDRSIAGIMVTVESEAGTDVGRIVSADNCTLNLPLTFIWTVPDSDYSCLYVRVNIFETYGPLYEVNYTTCANFGCRYYYNAGALGGINSYDYLDFYPDGLNCTYVIYSLARATIFLQFQKFDLEEAYGRRCYYQVTVSYDNQTKSLMCDLQSTEDARNRYFISTTGVMYVQFYVDPKLHSRFSALYYEMQNTECNKTFTNLYGIIGNINSSANRQIPYCEYDIRLPSFYNIEITLDYLYLARDNDKQCTYPPIELIHTDDSENITLCGYKTDLPGSRLLYRHHNNTLRMRYYTGHNIDDHVGFQIRYRGLPACVNETFSNKTGTLSSFNYPDNYINGHECYSVIEVIDSFVIELHFDILYTESVNDTSLQGNLCTFDYIELYVNDETYRICGNWNGKEHLLRFVFNSSKIVITFVSNETDTRPGYKVTWYALGPEQHHGTCLAPLLDTWRYCYEIVYANVSWWEGLDACRQKGAMLATVDDIQTIGMLSKALGQRCFESAWIGANDIESEGEYYWADKSRVKSATWFRSWTVFSSNKQPSDGGLSDEDCVELRKQLTYPVEEEGNTGKYLWKNKQCDSKNSYICQYLKSDYTETSSNLKEDCDMDILLTNDNPVATLMSPFFPTDYPDDLDCNIIIKAPIGSHPTLQFHYFDIEDSDNCIFDNVTVTDSIATSPFVFCGNWTDRLNLLQKISTTNLILVRFRTDRSSTAVGFSATVEFITSKLCPEEELGPKWFAGPNSCFHLPTKRFQTYLDASKTCEGARGDILNELTPSCIFFLGNVMDDLKIENGSSFWIQGNTSVTTNGSRLNAQLEDHLPCSAVRLYTWHNRRYRYTVRTNIFLQAGQAIEHVSCSTELNVICTKPLTGLLGQITVCDSNPCKNGQCSLTPRGFACTCNLGFWGVLCEKDELVCRYTVCSGHGNCIGQNTSHPSCYCTSGWTGAKCDVSVPTLYQGVSIGEKLMKEPMWIGMSLVMVLSVLFCISYAIRRKCGDRIIQFFSKRTQRSADRKSSQVIDIPRTETESTTDIRLSTSPTVLLNMQAQTRKYVDIDCHERLGSPVINENNREAAARFFASYKSFETQITSDPNIQQHGGSMEPGGQLKFSFDSPSATRWTRSRSFNLQPDSRTTGTMNQDDVMFRHVGRTVSLGLQSGAENPGIYPDRKVMNPRASLMNSEHYYPNIIILNEDNNNVDTSKYSNGRYNDKDKKSWNSDTFRERFSPDKHRDELSADSGCSSTSNPENIQYDRPQVSNEISLDADILKHSLAAERRRQYVSKSKNTSFYNSIIECDVYRRRIAVELSDKEVSKSKQNTQQSHNISRKFECNCQKNARHKITRTIISRYSSSDDLLYEPQHHKYHECKCYKGTDGRTGRREYRNRMCVHEYVSRICVDRHLRHAYSLPECSIRCHSRSREKLHSYSPSAKRRNPRSPQLKKSSSSFENDHCEPYNSVAKKRSYHCESTTSGSSYNQRISQVHDLCKNYTRLHKQDLTKMRGPLSPQFDVDGDSSSSSSIRSSQSCSTIVSVQYLSSQVPDLTDYHPKDSAYQSQHSSLDSRPSADSNCTDFDVRSEPRCPESTVQKQLQRTAMKLTMLKRQQAYNFTSKDSDFHTSENEPVSEEIGLSLSRERFITKKSYLEYFEKKKQIFSEVEEEKFGHIQETSLEREAQKNSHGENMPITIFLPSSKEQKYCGNRAERIQCLVNECFSYSCFKLNFLRF